MRIKKGDFTVGDVGVSITYTTDITLTGIDTTFVFIKPSGQAIRRTATQVSGTVATYTWASGDLDEAGEWICRLEETDTGYYFTPVKERFSVAEKPEDQARDQ